MRQIPLAIGHRGTASFDTFEPGDNAAVLDALSAWLDRWSRTRGLEHAPSRAAAPLYLWGPSGCGKTHLLTALVASVQAAGGRVVWVGGEAAADAGPGMRLRASEAAGTAAGVVFRTADAADPAPLLARGGADVPASESAFAWLDEPACFDPGIDLVVIDDCDRLDAADQRRAFRAFVEAADAGFAVVAAGRAPPVDLPVREDLRTRLGWGEVHQVLPLSEAETRATLRQEADRRGIFLGDEVMAYLLTRFQRDLRSLMALLDRLDTYALSSKRAVTLPLLRRMLDEEDRRP